MLGIGRVWLPVRLRGSFFRRTVVRRPPVGRDRLPVRLRGSFLRRTVVRRPPVGRDRLPVRLRGSFPRCTVVQRSPVGRDRSLIFNGINWVDRGGAEGLPANGQHAYNQNRNDRS